MVTEEPKIFAPVKIDPVMSPEVLEENYTCNSNFSWEKKHPKHWNKFDVCRWCSYIFHKYCPNTNLNYISNDFSQFTGTDLMDWNEHHFEKRHSEMGKILFIIFRDLVDFSPEPLPGYNELNHENKKIKSSSDDEDSDYDIKDSPKHEVHSEDMNHNIVKIGARRGRKPGQKTKGNHLWEFLRDILNDPSYNPSLIRWHDRDQGIFLIESTKDVAAMWGNLKKNKKMTYEKLARAMRYCRQTGDFDTIPRGYDVPKKRCFKFGSRTHGWRESETSPISGPRKSLQLEKI